MNLRLRVGGTGMIDQDHIRRLALIAKRAKSALWEAPRRPRVRRDGKFK
jgi:hypothetical protein